MHNIVSLPPDRRRPQRALAVPRSGARILFFTGVRYCRDEESTPYVGIGALRAGSAASGSDRVFDAAAH